MTAAADTRTQIMDAFGDQLAATGYPGISLVGVARTVGIRKPSIYHHFPGGKEDLYAAVAVRYIDTLRDRIGRALERGGTLEERLVELAAAGVEHGGATISFEQRVYDALDHVGAETRERVSGLYVTEVLDPVVALFADAVDAGTLSGDPRFLMNAFLHLVRAGDPASAPDDVRRIVALFLDGARPR